MGEFQEVAGGQEKGKGFLYYSGVLFSFTTNTIGTKQKESQTQGAVPENTPGPPKPDSLCSHYLGDGFV